MQLELLSERVQLSLRLAVIRQLVADFSAGNGGAVDAVVSANVGSGGKVTQIPIMLFRLICGSTGGWGLLWNFLRAIQEVFPRLKSLLKTTYNTSSLD
jgi:hypothetical protein